MMSKIKGLFIVGIVGSMAHAQANKTSTPPLKVESVFQYHCFDRTGTLESKNRNYYEHAINQHYYYIEKKTPSPVPNLTKGYTFCHNIHVFGQKDSRSFPRLANQENAFSLWSSQDSRMDNLNGEIQQRLHDEYGLNTPYNSYFHQLSFYGRPNVGPGSNIHDLGHILDVFVDEKTNLAFCPTETHFRSSEPIFKVLGDYIQNDTEGLFMGFRELVTYHDETTGEDKIFPEDYLLLNESLLHKIGFYFDNGVAIPIDQKTVHTKTVHFYWPANEGDPLEKHSGQQLFTIKHPNENKNLKRQEVVHSTSYIPSDRRFACIPKIESSQVPLKEVGASCSSDFQCQSTCCGEDGMCKTHLPGESFTCNKPSGEQCLSKEYCRQEIVKVCKIYQVSTDAANNPQCALICENKPQFGDCLNNVCQPVKAQAVPVDDPADPSVCANAPVYNP